ncbi:MAG: hypothetical protein WCT19_00050 [Candidatus Paceibacterota bacterium]|jgi:hypothetical protein
MTTTLQKPIVKPASLAFAKNLFQRGTDCFDPALVSEVLDIKLPEASPIPFGEVELAEAHTRGDQLIWLPSVDASGKPITMKRLHDDFKNEAPLGGKLLFDTDWYKDEPFFTEHTARTGKSNLGSWRLVGITAIPDTKGVNYLEQTIIAAKFVAEEIYGGNPPEHLKPILQEPTEREQEIAKLMNKNWQEAARILAGMPFNRQFRGTPVELLIQVLLNQKVNSFRFLENEYAWTNVLSSHGYLVPFGYADSSGAYVDRWRPQLDDGSFGFFLSRSENVESES